MAKQKPNTAIYKRDPKTRGQDFPYERKFAGLIKLCETTKAKGVQNVVVTWPWVIGDTYEEVIESLSRLADAGLVLHVVERHTPGEIHLPKVSRN